MAQIRCKNTKPHSEYVTLLAFPGNNGNAKAPQSYKYNACLVKNTYGVNLSHRVN